MESTDKLRNYVSAFISPGAEADLLGIADEIEQEIAERYMELPVDADGVPIHVGDVLTNGKDEIEARFVDSDGVAYDFICSLTWELGTNLRHVNPRTIEDVLHEFELDAHDVHTPDEYSELLSKYADELRSMGVGE